MAVEESLKTALGSLGGVHALVKPTKSATPAIVYQRVSRTTNYDHEGNPLMYRDRYQITCLATSYKAMRTLREGVEAALGGNTTNFVLCMPLEGGRPDDLDDGIRISSRDYYIWSKP